MGDQDKQKTPQERLALLRSEKWCLRCGKHKHDKTKDCWAKSAQCHQCGRVGHLKSLCLDDEVDSNALESERGDHVHVDDDTNSPDEEGSEDSSSGSASPVTEQKEEDVGRLGHLSVQDQDSRSSSSTDGSDNQGSASDGAATTDDDIGDDYASGDHVDGMISVATFKIMTMIIKMITVKTTIQIDQVK